MKTSTSTPTRSWLPLPPAGYDPICTRLERLDKRVLYFDTDSIIGVSRPGEADGMTGTRLGEFTTELGNQQFILFGQP